MDELRVHKRINRKPSMFGLPVPLFMTMIAPLMFLALFGGLAFGLLFSVAGAIVLVLFYFFLLKKQKEQGRFFYVKFLHSLNNSFTGVKNNYLKGRLRKK